MRYLIVLGAIACICLLIFAALKTGPETLVFEGQNAQAKVYSEKIVFTFYQPGDYELQIVGISSPYGTGISTDPMTITAPECDGRPCVYTLPLNTAWDISHASIFVNGVAGVEG